MEIEKLSDGHFFGYENIYKKIAEREYKATAKTSSFTLVFVITKKMFNKIIFEYEDEKLKKDLV